MRETLFGPQVSDPHNRIKVSNNRIRVKVALELFLTDPNIALDNNVSERQLRLIALGRKNYLFVGHDVAGQNLAILQTFVATCVANDVNPQEYLTDVLIRIQTHPQSKIDELLPHKWKPRRRQASAITTPNLRTSRSQHPRCYRMAPTLSIWGGSDGYGTTSKLQSKPLIRNCKAG